jgi:hypothetical protein
MDHHQRNQASDGHVSDHQTKAHDIPPEVMDYVPGLPVDVKFEGACRAPARGLPDRPRPRGDAQEGDGTGVSGRLEDQLGVGLPLIVLCSVIHVLGLGLINEKVARMLEGLMDRRHFTSMVWPLGSRQWRPDA